MNAVTPQSPSLHFMDTDFTVNWLAPRWSEIWPIKLCHKYIPYTANVIGHKIEMERLQENHTIPYSMQGCSLCSVFQSLCSFCFNDFSERASTTDLEKLCNNPTRTVS